MRIFFGDLVFCGFENAAAGAEAVGGEDDGVIIGAVGRLEDFLNEGDVQLADF